MWFCVTVWTGFIQCVSAHWIYFCVCESVNRIHLLCERVDWFHVVCESVCCILLFVSGSLN